MRVGVAKVLDIDDASRKGGDAGLLGVDCNTDARGEAPCVFVASGGKKLAANDELRNGCVLSLTPDLREAVRLKLTAGAPICTTRMRSFTEELGANLLRGDLGNSRKLERGLDGDCGSVTDARLKSGSETASSIKDGTV